MNFHMKIIVWLGSPQPEGRGARKIENRWVRGSGQGRGSVRAKQAQCCVLGSSGHRIKHTPAPCAWHVHSEGKWVKLENNRLA